MNQYLLDWAGKELMAELEEGVINAPQDLLGCHIFKEEDVQIFTAYRPCAEKIWLLDEEGEEVGEMEEMPVEGLFGYVIEKKAERLKNIPSVSDTERMIPLRYRIPILLRKRCRILTAIYLARESIIRFMKNLVRISRPWME